MTSPSQTSFSEIVRQVYLRRATGSISFADGDDRYLFQQGELFIDQSHPLAPAIEARLNIAPAARPADDLELRRLSLQVVEPALNRRAEVRFDGGTGGFPASVLGPLTTVTLAMESAVFKADENTLIHRLGGETARFQNRGDSPALQQLPGLEGAMLQLMAHLESPTPVSILIKLNPGSRFDTLVALTKLRAIGLVGGEPNSTSRGRRARRRERSTVEPTADDLGNPSQSPSTARSRPRGHGGSQVLTARSLELFSERIAEDLKAKPLALEAEEHRQILAHWLAHQGHMNHYELLQLDAEAEDEALHQNYRRMARQAHPLHVGPLGLKGMGEALRLLFERLTEAYLVLSDPKRRAGYDLIIGVAVEQKVDERKRLEEKQRMAASCYSNALHYLSEHVRDYGQAVQLLEEATRLDPQASYFSMLGQSQAQNPRWRSTAIESFKRAVELDPRDAGIRVAFADVLERDGALAEAKVQFRAALEDMPNHPLALKGLERLSGHGGQADAPGNKLGDSWRRIFGKPDSTE